MVLAQLDWRRIMNVAATVEFQGVKVIAESERALCCRIMWRDHWIPPHNLLEGSTVAHFGDRGVLVVSRQFAEDEGMCGAVVTA